MPADESPRTPDALKIPTEFPLPAGTTGPRFHALFDMAERILQADPTKGEKAHRFSLVREGMHFYSLDPASTLLFPYTSIHAGRPRYHWVPQADGTQFGYLTDDARAELAAR